MCIRDSHKSEIKKNKKEDPKKEQKSSYVPVAYTTGTAMVYLSDPLSFAQVAYGATGYTAVSYTHLDVYKRQIYFSATQQQRRNLFYRKFIGITAQKRQEIC